VINVLTVFILIFFFTKYQMEEEAMTDLRKFYQTDDVHEEYIVVERVTSGLVATPIWRSPQK